MPDPSARLPPPHLASRVGPGPGQSPLEAFDSEGASVRRHILRLLPPDWSFEDKRVLDFGCGSGRVLRHFLADAGHAELWGCDIDGPSIEWLQANLSPPVRCFQNGTEPPLPLESEYIDLMWATSVFTHIEHWAGWLLELHRVLRPGGILVASFLGRGMWEARVREPYREDQVGMTVVGAWRGPRADVLHSEWWLRAHWGRAFEVLDVAHPAPNPDGSPAVAHSYIALRKRSGHFTREALERIDPDEPREVLALETNVRVQRYELAALAEQRPLRELVRERLLRTLQRSPLIGPARLLRQHLRRSPR